MLVRNTKLLLILLSIMSMAWSCAINDHNKRNLAPTIVWPEKPAQARVLYGGVIHDQSDLGINPSWFSRLKDFLFGEQEVSLVKPMDMLVTKNETIYVVDPGVGGLHRFDTKESSYAVIRLEKGRPMPSPVAVCLGADGIYVSDSALGVFTVNSGDSYARSVQLNKRPKQATGLAYSVRKKQLFVTDTAEHNIKVYDEHGQLVRTIGERGEKPGQFNYPTLLWLDSGDRLYVSDSLNFRIQIFSGEGEFLNLFGQAGNATGHHSRPKGVATDKYGHIYVVDALFHTVQVFDRTGRFLLNFGAHGGGYGEFWLPAGIFIDVETSRIYVADSYNKRVQVFNYVGDGV